MSTRGCINGTLAATPFIGVFVAAASLVFMVMMLCDIFSEKNITMSTRECINGTLAATGTYSSPVPFIGVYVAAASLVCMVMMLCDIVNGFRAYKRWLPCKLFTLNSVTITLLSIATKLPVDLTTQMPSVQDQLSKLSGTVLICIAMGFFAPSVGIASKSESFANMAALTIFVLTIIGNISIQIYTGVIVLFVPEYIITLSFMFILLITLWSSSLDAGYHKFISTDGSKSYWARSVGPMLKRLKYCQFLTYSTNPQFVASKLPTNKGYIGAICLVSLFVQIQAAVRTLMKKVEFCGGNSDYHWSVVAIVIVQTLTVIVGSVAVNFRCLTMAFYNDFKLENAQLKNNPVAKSPILRAVKSPIQRAVKSTIQRAVSIQYRLNPVLLSIRGRFNSVLFIHVPKILIWSLLINTLLAFIIMNNPWVASTALILLYLAVMLSIRGRFNPELFIHVKILYCSLLISTLLAFIIMNNQWVALTALIPLYLTVLIYLPSVIQHLFLLECMLYMWRGVWLIRRLFPLKKLGKLEQWTTRKAAEDRKRLREAGRRDFPSHMFQLLLSTTTSSSSSQLQFNGTKLEYQGLDVSSLTIVLVVRVAQVVLPDKLSRSLVQAFVEVKELIHFIDKTIHPKNLRHRNMFLLAKAAWAHKDFRCLIPAKLRDGFMKLEDEDRRLRVFADALPEDPVLMELKIILDFIKETKSLTGKDLHTVLKETFVGMLRVVLAKLPCAINTSLTESPAEDFEKRVRFALQQLFRMRRFHGQIQWSFPDNCTTLISEDSEADSDDFSSAAESGDLNQVTEDVTDNVSTNNDDTATAVNPPTVAANGGDDVIVPIEDSEADSDDFLSAAESGDLYQVTGDVTDNVSTNNDDTATAVNPPIAAGNGGDDVIIYVEDYIPHN